MDTKLKNTIRNKWFKLTLYLAFTAISFALFFTLITSVSNISKEMRKENLFDTYNILEPLLIEDYLGSSDAISRMNFELRDISDVISEYVNITDNYDKVKKNNPDIKNIIEKATTVDKGAIVVSEELLNVIKRDIFLENFSNYSFYIKLKGGVAFKSEDLIKYSEKDIRDEIKDSSINYIISEDKDFVPNKISSTLNNINNPFLDEDKWFIQELYIAMDEDTTIRKIENFNQIKSAYNNIGSYASISLIAMFIIFILLSLGAGRKPNQEGCFENAFDYIFIEIKALATIFMAFIVAGGLRAITFSDFMNYNFSGFTFFLTSLFPTVIVFIGLVSLISIIKNFKSEKRINRSIIAIFINLIRKTLRFITRSIKAFFKVSDINAETRSIKIRTFTLYYIGFSALSMLISALFIAKQVFGIALIIWIIEVIATSYFMITLKKILMESDKIFENNIVESNKSERTKTQLISNVSHDLKTPLTSIIGYIDLLSKEELNEQAKEYVDILGRKSENLKDIISDLFILSKSESGNLSVEMEKIDFNKLLKQTLADMEDLISKSNMDIKINTPEEPVYIISDGKKLYRVLQNLIDNALKYSLRGTRIYINLKANQNIATFKIKNIASYEMDFDEKEIRERFVRGDESRSEEGSGLGLAIAESFVQNLDGFFDINIDGDVFEVIIKYSIAD